jgi:ribosomal protein L32
MSYPDDEEERLLKELRAAKNKDDNREIARIYRELASLSYEEPDAIARYFWGRPGERYRALSEEYEEKFRREEEERDRAERERRETEIRNAIEKFDTCPKCGHKGEDNWINNIPAPPGSPPAYTKIGGGTIIHRYSRCKNCGYVRMSTDSWYISDEERRRMREGPAEVARASRRVIETMFAPEREVMRKYRG